MPKTPRAAGQEPPKGYMFPEDILAAQVRGLRASRRVSQQALADRMTYLGHSWSQSTVARVERAVRSVSIGELFCLALALQAPPTELLDLERAGARGIYLAEGAALRTEDAQPWLTKPDPDIVSWDEDNKVAIEPEESGK